MAQSNQQGKTMSSRLSTMRFMQRAAASNTKSPRTPSEPAAKKQRLSNGSYNSSPATPQRTNADVVAEAQSAEQLKREEVLTREASDRGDTKWYLSFNEQQSPDVPSPLRVVSAGYGALDSRNLADASSGSDEDSPTPKMQGRMNFGKFSRKPQKQEAIKEEDPDSNSSSVSEDDDESDDPTGTKALIAQGRRDAGNRAREERKAKRKSDSAEASRMAEERRKKDVNLNAVSSISGGNGGVASKHRALKDRDCFSCGGKGHMQYDCPREDRRNNRKAF